MFGWLRNLLSSTFKEPEVSIGETWYLDRSNPWERKFIYVKVLDIKDGWVKYVHCDSHKVPYDCGQDYENLNFFTRCFKREN